NLSLFYEDKISKEIGVFSLDHENNMLFTKTLNLNSKENLEELKKYLEQTKNLTLFYKHSFFRNILELFKIENISFDINKFQKYEICEISEEVDYYFKRTLNEYITENLDTYYDEDDVEYYSDLHFAKSKSIISIYEELFKEKIDNSLANNL